MKTMQAAVVHEFGKPLIIEERPIPEPQEGEILVKIEACGVCHTDLHAAEGKVKAEIETQPLKAINAIFERMKHGQINGRVVLDMHLN